jgi:hypothetical protein
MHICSAIRLPQWQHGCWEREEIASGGSGDGGDHGYGWGAQVANADLWAGAFDGRSVPGPSEGSSGHGLGEREG